ncbi:MAG: NUDIX hydrolase, partial [Gammaproteobacteria bacterium]
MACLAILLIAGVRTLQAGELLEQAWDEERARLLLDKTLYLHLDFDAAGYTGAERAAAQELIAAGHRLHTLYLTQRHAQGAAAEAAMGATAPQHLRDLFRIMKGPIATTLENQREAFLGVMDEVKGKNVYPRDATRESLDAWFAAHPESREDLLHLRSAVVMASRENKANALATLRKYPVLETLHPGLRESIDSARTYLALPYSVAYADDILYVYERLHVAADLIDKEDVAFARFLRLRARDLLADDYDGGDATWVTGAFTGNLNAQIGSYETYDDALYGVKSFFSLSLLQRDREKSDELAAAIGDIQAIEDALPYEARKRVRSNIPVGVYRVVADFGQARGTNTATILPNEGHLSRQFGRTILIRGNILRNPELFAESRKAYRAATDTAHHDELDIDGGFYRTLWHEIGHYLGPDQTRAGGDIDAALQDTADLFEEMKADLVSLFAARMLAEKGYHSPERLRAIYAGGVRRVLQKNQPRREQAYGTMQLIQWNWFLDKGLLRFEDGRLRIDYERYPETVDGLLREVLAIQHDGDRARAKVFTERWTAWDDDLHGV